MLKYFQNNYAMSEKGAKDLLHSIIWTIVMDISFMLPVILGFKFLDEDMSLLLNSSNSQGNSVLYYVIMSGTFFLLMFVIAYFQYDSTYTKIYEESARRRISLAETLRKLPLAFFGKKDIADLSSTIMEDATQIEQQFSHAVPQIYAAMSTVLIIGVMMFFYNWMLSLAVFWVVPVAVLVFYLSRKLQNRMHKELYDVKRDISDNIQEGLDSVYEIKSYNREDAFSRTLNTKLDNYEKFMIKSELLIGAFVNLSYVILKLGLPSVILVGAYLLSTGSIDIFTYLVFLVVTARIYNPIMDALNNFALLLFLNVRIKRMKEMDDMPGQEGKTEFRPKNYDIGFNNVDFSYQDSVQTLKNVNFTAKQGDVTALIGPSGGGKSTVAKLSARFWDIDKGTITLGGEDISLVDPETLLKNYSIVFQDVTLFNSSVMDNIRLGKKDATDEEVMKAAQLAQCDEFVKKLPQGYDTLIGENGERLSGGERQRISIARAILKDAPIILLDEATASLDAENESKIQKALSELIKNKTVLIIAHRMRTVLGADKIVVIKDGVIAETGTPLELKEKQGIFSSMLKAQYQSI
ncbi:ABC transporter ATP-binding protein [Methanosarcina spelaei]|uniref:ABC transporter ATP-binding protein n=1 Tax=Methanosarcina spelaei TaxID=1036679 RepID=A0A2A2HUG2_9EURY|nr:ABC transporter ATP-binding protein [Methanosarcina spelaei]PAV13107.1 ABC transporter ATP-binding protein [Methanosarcina spelaei]